MPLRSRVVPLVLVGPVLAASLVAAGAESSYAAARPTCDGLRATIVGTPRDDRIVGTARRDVVVGLGGDDTLIGRGGDDVLCGGDGADRLRGGRGKDRLHGGRARLNSDRGGVYLVPDVLDGGPGDDLLDTGRDARGVSDESQAVSGVLRWRQVTSGVSVDLSDGRRGTAVVGGDRDRIVVRGRMEIDATPYADTILGSGRAETIAAGAGADTVLAGGGDDQVTTDPAVIGPSADADTADTVDAGPGDDSVDSAGGADTIHGGAGDDALRSLSGSGRLYGDDGDDQLVLVLGQAPGYVIDGGAGRDLGALEADLPADYGVAMTISTVPQTISRGATVFGRIAGIEQTQLAGELQWTYVGSDAPDDVVGGFSYPLTASTLGGHDTVLGSDQDDVIDAGDGTDTVDGRGGTDTCVSAEVVRGCER